jgi:tetratricopeptide (TPR) repeat protein
MTLIAKDQLGPGLTGSTERALAAYERALACTLSWRGGAEVHLEAALGEAPEFVMAYVLKAYLLLCSREPSAQTRAACILQHALQFPITPHARLHLAAVAAAVEDDLERSASLLAAALDDNPHDALALHVGQSLDYLGGNSARMHEVACAAISAWSSDMPNYPSVLAMHAFALEECGEYARAEELALRVLELEPRNVRAHHVLAHVFEMLGAAHRGIEWMRAHEPSWRQDSAATTHCWWHTALFHLQETDPRGALLLYDRHLRPAPPYRVADLIDASSLLWRLSLLGADVGDRWLELAQRWSVHISDGYCTFSDLHAMMAFVGAGAWTLAKQLLTELCVRQHLGTRHGEMSRLVGLPACRALVAFGEGESATAVALLGNLPSIAHRLGGSHAQRDIVHLTLLEAVKRLRRQPWRWSSERQRRLDLTESPNFSFMPAA